MNAVESILQEILQHRTIKDITLLGQLKPIWEWGLLVGGGLLLGLSIARAAFYRALPKALSSEDSATFSFPNITWPNWYTYMVWPSAAVASTAAIAAPTNRSSKSIGERKDRFIPEPDDFDPATPIFQPIDSDDREEPKRTVYLMDVSLSLSDNQFERCKNDLIQAIKDLPEQARYQVIFFSGTAWFAHQEMVEGGNQHEPVVIADGDERHHWKNGFASQFTYENGNDNLPVGSFLIANSINKAQTIKQVDDVQRSYGTTWHLPFMLAMSMDETPEHIFFLTDGETAHQDVVATGIIELVEQMGAETRVDTRALGKAQRAKKHLKAISTRTGGHFANV